jgi:hypothetical protein
VKVVGQRIVDGLDLRIGEELLVRPVGLRDAERTRGVARDREAIATTVVSAPCCIAGMTFLTAIPATPSTPQRTLPVPFACAMAVSMSRRNGSPPAS